MHLYAVFGIEVFLSFSEVIKFEQTSDQEKAYTTKNK